MLLQVLLLSSFLIFDSYLLLRAPEIVLGLPFTEAIDVWGVGCILAFLFLATHIFPVDSEAQMVGQIPQTNVPNK